MKHKFQFDLMSDLHEDINNFFMPRANPGVNTLVLAGDLAEYASLKNTGFAILKEAKANYKHVVYVPGNHEYYGGNYQDVNNKLREVCDRIGVNFLQRDVFEVPGEDVMFMGATLFTDMNNGDENTIRLVRQVMADFTYVTYGEGNPLVLTTEGNAVGGGRKIVTPRDYMYECKLGMDFFERTAKAFPDKKIVLVTHHAMTEKCVMPRFFAEYHVNGGYRSRFEEFFRDNRNIAVHCHGHMHDFIRTHEYNTRIYCNPYGYQRYEPKANYAPLMIEV